MNGTTICMTNASQTSPAQLPSINQQSRIVPPEIVERIRQLLIERTSYDSFGNRHIDLASISELTDKINARAATKG